MTLKLPRAVIFDWDNTLVDSWPAIAEAVNYARVALCHEAWSLEQIRANCTRAARESFPEWFGADWKKAYDIYYRNFDEIRRRREIPMLRGAEELLRWLKAQAIPAFVVSNKRGDYLRLEAERLNWLEYFVKVVGAQDAPLDKPAREHVDHALQASGIVADASVWFIGDSEADMLCARNAGCTPIFIGSAADAGRLGVTRVFSDCQGLLSALTMNADM
jgi:phosphoglycolate phosphatase